MEENEYGEKNTELKIKNLSATVKHDGGLGVVATTFY